MSKQYERIEKALDVAIQYVATAENAQDGE